MPKVIKDYWRYVAFDESMNGNFPTFYTGAFSNNLEDIKDYLTSHFPKKRKGRFQIPSLLETRDYTFLLYTKTDHDILKPHQRKGIVIASLIKDEPLSNEPCLFMDGEMSRREIDFTKGLLKEVAGIETETITLEPGANLDRRILLVNIADELAFWLSKKSIIALKENPKQKSIPKEYFELSKNYL